MRLHALLSWFDEPLAMLEALVTSLPLAGVTDLVALDGAYRQFPGGLPFSTDAQVEMLIHRARDLSLGVTLGSPTSLWADEMVKRSTMFEMALATSGPDDWWLVVDADTPVVAAPSDLLDQLDQASAQAYDVVRGTVRDPQDPMVAQAQRKSPPWSRTGHYPHRLLFRAQEIRVEGRHCRYKDDHGRNLWAPVQYGPEVPALAIPDLILEHRDEGRSPGRLARQKAYYHGRDGSGVEA